MELEVREKDKGRDNKQERPSENVIGNTATTGGVSYNTVLHT